MKDILKLCMDNTIICIVVLYLLYHFGVFQKLCECLGLSNEGMANQGVADQKMHLNQPVASEQMGENEMNRAVNLSRTPSTCYPQQTLKPEDLLPKEQAQAVNEFNASKPVAEGILQGVNLLDSSYHVGVNTVGQSLRNANRQLRSEPPNPQVNVSPWLNTTIGPDLSRRPLEIEESCGSQQ